uniref:Uncharacterized protein n=1 Tax=Vitis vinifera TaxID=29760 RepID=A5AD57_VITVI|nr:hypothetical protein VITISV_012519 [Vitis vinifera]
MLSDQGIRFKSLEIIRETDSPLPDDTWHAPLSGSTLSVPPKRTRGAYLYLGPPRGAYAHVHLAAAGIPGTRGINIGAFCGNSLILSTAKMSTPSRSRSSARGDEDYFEWREAIERRQLESER